MRTPLRTLGRVWYTRVWRVHVRDTPIFGLRSNFQCGMADLNPRFRFRAKMEDLAIFEGLLPESYGQNLASTVLYVPNRGTSLIRNSPPLGPFSRMMPKALWWPQGVSGFL